MGETKIRQQRFTVNPTSMIHDMARQGRITASQAAWLLELRRELAWRRRPWWDKTLTIMFRMLFE